MVSLVGDDGGDVLLEVGERGEPLVLLLTEPRLRVRLGVDADRFVLQRLVHDKVLELLGGVLEQAELAAEFGAEIDKLVVDARLDDPHARHVLLAQVLDLLLDLVLDVVEDGGAVRGSRVELRLDRLHVHRV